VGSTGTFLDLGFQNLGPGQLQQSTSFSIGGEDESVSEGLGGNNADFLDNLMQVRVYLL
jgi:hypothetical protein